MSSYSILGRTVGEDDPIFQGLLKAAHERRERPRCLCREGGVPVYVARVGEQYFVKRLPKSGLDHAPTCDRYEMPPALSGKAEVLGGAIVENDDSTATVKLDVPLRKGQARGSPNREGGPQATIKASASKLTLRGLLDYLWDEARLNLMAPGFVGRRSWGLVRKQLVSALSGKSSAKLSFEQLIYVPEVFSAEHKDEISARRRRFLAAAKDGNHKTIVVGAVKSLEPSRFGGRLTILHLPDFPLYMKEEMFKRVQKRFAGEFSLWDGFKGSHLVAIAVVALTESGLGQVDEVGFMNVSSDWLPFLNATEYELIERLTTSGRRFVKTLRYDVAPSAPLAFGLLLDAAGDAVVMFMIPGDVPEDQMALYEEAIAETPTVSWRWRTDEAMPPLPPVGSSRNG